MLTAGESPVVELAGHEVTALARDGAAWWAITGGQEAWRSDGDGKWARQATAPTDVRSNCLAGTPAGVLVGTSDARLFRLHAEALDPIDSFDQVEGRGKWYTPWGGPPDSRSISVDPVGTIYVNIHVGGIIRSRDGGRSWEPTIDVDSDVHRVVTVDGRPGLVLAACAEGLAASDDSGETWTFDTEGLHGSYCRAVAVAGDALFVSASEGYRGRRSALYRRSLDSDEPFDRCEHGLPESFGSNIDSHCLAALGSVVAFGTEEGALYRSEDAGETWETAATGLPPVRCLLLA